MDITLLKTFLEVAATGSFVSASDRLFVTQSAVSLRVQRLEDSLGQSLFTRSKAGAELTPAGIEFERFALSMIKIWEEARQQIAIPEGFNKSFVIGSQYSLWPRLGFQWIDSLQKEMPQLSIRGEVGMPDRLTRFLTEGIIQAALSYTPQMRPGLEVEKILDDELVLVSSWANPTSDLKGKYIYVDWGPEFAHAHSVSLPELTSTSGLTLALGALSAEYVLNRNAAAYLPARYIKRYLDVGVLHLVPDAPTFPYPIWVVWRNDVDPEIRKPAHKALLSLCKRWHAAQDEVRAGLSEISADSAIAALGSGEVDFK